VPERRPPLGALRKGLAEAASELRDSGGLREPETLDRFGIQRTTTARRRTLPSGRSADLVTRGVAGAAAGGLALAGLETLGPNPRFSSTAAAAAVAIGVALLPRAGWLLAAGGFVAWLGWNLYDGTALVVGAALACSPVLAPRTGRAWSLPAAAPILGTVALAPLFPAIAGFATTAARRAGLAAAGFMWLACAELLTSDRLLYGAPVDAAPRSDWTRSVGGGASDALAPLATSPVLLGAVVWGLAAALLPLVVRGRSLASDVAGAALWAALLVAAQRGVAELAASALGTADARGALAGAILGAVAAVAARASGLWESPRGHAPFP